MKEHVENNGDFDDRPIVRSIVNKTLLGLLCGSLGFGASQLTVVSDVRVHSNELGNLRTSLADERNRTDQRIFHSLLTDHLPQRKTP